jgi:hypothetical protein
MAQMIRFTGTLKKPEDATREGWTFVVLPDSASARLPSRGPVTVEGTLGGATFVETLLPDGAGSHWLRVHRRLAKAAGAVAGDRIEIALAPAAVEPEPKVPSNLRAALKASPGALATWDDITPVARRDWILWIESAKKAETRARRVDVACDKLASGQRRACCFDRSGMVGGGMSAPKAAGD